LDRFGWRAGVAARFPRYSWPLVGSAPDENRSPDQCHDTHGRTGATTADPCDFSQVQALIVAGDPFLLNTVGAIMNSSAWTGNSVIFITWDEATLRAVASRGSATTVAAATRLWAKAAGVS
jgi:hypothetical protein